MRNAAILASVLLALSVASHAAPAFDAAARAEAVAPFIDDMTVAIGRLALSRVDMEAIWAVVVELLPERERQDVKEMAKTKQFVRRWIKAFLAAGGRDIFWVGSLADIPPKPLLLVAPLQSGADARTIRALLYSGRADGPVSRPAEKKHGPLDDTSLIHGAAVHAHRQVLERVAALKPDPRPELAKAFAAAGDTAVQVLILPTRDNRRVIEEMLPRLPKELGGGPSTVLTRGVQWAGIGIDLPPKMGLRAVIQSNDAAAAKALQQLIPRMIQASLTEASVGLLDGMVAQPQIRQITRALTPNVAGDRVVLSLAHEQMLAAVRDFLAGPVRRVRQSSKWVIVARNLQILERAIRAHAKDNQGAWPESLEVLVQQKRISAKLLVNPIRPQRKPAYLYIKPRAPRGKVPPQRILVYEAYDQWPGGINVLFVDGHVALLSREAELHRHLREAGVKPPTSSPAAK